MTSSNSTNHPTGNPDKQTTPMTLAELLLALFGAQQGMLCRCLLLAADNQAVIGILPILLKVQQSGKMQVGDIEAVIERLATDFENVATELRALIGDAPVTTA